MFLVKWIWIFCLSEKLCRLSSMSLQVIVVLLVVPLIIGSAIDMERKHSRFVLSHLLHAFNFVGNSCDAVKNWVLNWHFETMLKPILRFSCFDR